LTVDCYPVTALPHVSPLFRDYVSGLTAQGDDKLRSFYSPFHRENQWMQRPPIMEDARRQAIVGLLRKQNRDFGAGPATEANLDRLAEGAAAVVTGQQVGLFGGPLLTLLKAATAVRLASDASRNGHPHVPIFWLATEDHDFDEISHATFHADPDLSASGLRKLQLADNPAPGKPVGNIPLGDGILPLIEELHRCLGANSISELLTSLYTPTATFASAFASFLTRIFSEHGLIVIDAAARPFHALANTTLRVAIEQADEIQSALLERSQNLEHAGYHAQVMVGGSSSLLFLIDEITGVRTALKKAPGGRWSAGTQQYSTADLLAILDATPERISPNVLLRPVMQDTLLPTSVYIGGPAEIAYFAQSQVVYQHILGSVTPVLPRYSATLIEPRLRKILERHQLSLPDIFTTSDALAHLLGARAMPVEGKRKLSAAGNALDRELKTLTEWMHAQDQSLGHAADVAASKMLYQMNRLRRLSATYTLQREQSFRRHADALCQELFPQGNLQERVLAGAWFLSRSGPSLIDLLIEQAQAGHCAHQALYL
jgi:bacillithiol biosynthesis cysteine-adding enzyme BshC